MSVQIRKLILLPLIVAVAGFFALLTREPPAPTKASGFDLVQAQTVLAGLARAPHPVGSAEHDRVKDMLVARLTAMGLSVQTQKDMGVRQAERRNGAISVAPVENIIAVLPGKNPSQKAVAVMAHYDSAHWSHGASDDGAGVVSILEAARILKSGPQPKRDVIFLITDSEETGLLGAQSFFDSHPLRSRVGIIVNVEARGSSGRAVMFQTSPNNAELIDLWATNAISPTGNSLAGAVYKRLPNDTDLSVPLAKGIDGINAAFVDGLPDYHMPTDKAEHLNPRSLQHLGDFAVTTTGALASADQLPTAAKGESAYFDLFGQFVVRYPVGWGWLLIGLAVAGLFFSQFSKLGVSKRQALAGLGQVALLTIAAGAATHFLARALYGPATIGLGLRDRIGEMNFALWVFIALIAGFTLATRPRAKQWVGAVLLALVFGLAAQIWMPGAHWLFVLPALIGIVVISIAARTGIGSFATLGTSAIIGGFAGTFLLQNIIAGYVSVVMITPAIITLIIPFALVLIGPLMFPYSENIWGRRIGFGLIAGSLLGALYLHFTNGFSARHPRPGDLFHWTDTEARKSWWATSSGKGELPLGELGKTKPEWLNWTSWRYVPAPPAPTTGPEITLVEAGGRVTVRLAGGGPKRALIFQVKPSVALEGATLNGKPVGFPANRSTRISWRGGEAAGDMQLSFNAGSTGKLDIGWLIATPGLPAGAPTPKGPTTDWTALNDSRVLTGRTLLEW